MTTELAINTIAYGNQSVPLQQRPQAAGAALPLPTPEGVDTHQSLVRSAPPIQKRCGTLLLTGSTQQANT